MATMFLDLADVPSPCPAQVTVRPFSARQQFGPQLPCVDSDLILTILSHSTRRWQWWLDRAARCSSQLAIDGRKLSKVKAASLVLNFTGMRRKVKWSSTSTVAA